MEYKSFFATLHVEGKTPHRFFWTLITLFEVKLFVYDVVQIMTGKDFIRYIVPTILSLICGT